MFRFLLAIALFFIIANPALFKLTGKLFGSMIASPEGLPTQAGVLLHALVFVIAGRLVGRFSRYADEPEMYADEPEMYEDEPETYEDEPETYEEETSEYTMTPGAY